MIFAFIYQGQKSFVGSMKTTWPILVSNTLGLVTMISLGMVLTKTSLGFVGAPLSLAVAYTMMPICMFLIIKWKFRTHLAENSMDKSIMFTQTGSSDNGCKCIKWSDLKEVLK